MNNNTNIIINNNHGNNNSKFNETKRPLIYDEFINPNNILSLENMENNHENYILKAPRKGKIIRGPVCTAYKRQNLGSIPRKTENILIDELKLQRTQRGFSSQSERFAHSYTKSDTLKYQFPGPGTYTTVKKFDYVVNDSSHHSSKGFGNGFASNTSRFEDCKEYYDKFLPGPGSYKSEYSTSLITNLNKTLNYKSLYNKTSTKPLKVTPSNPGPGTYNPLLLNKKSDFNEGENHYFKSENERFKKVPKSALGPGKYFRENNDFIIPKSPLKTKNYMNNADDGDMMNLYNTDNDFVKANRTSSYFFKNPSEKSENVIDKYIKTKNPLNNRKIETPGPGKYDIKKDNHFNWNFNFQDKKESLYIETLKLNKFKKRLQTAGNIKPKPLIDMNLQTLQTMKKINDDRLIINNNYDSPMKLNNNINNSNKKNMFLTNGFSKGKTNDAWQNNEEQNGYEINIFEKTSSPQRYPDYLIKKNIPGPAYYNPVKKPFKVNFNWNMERKWI